jgi:anti-sigma-K factor RskA
MTESHGASADHYLDTGAYAADALAPEEVEAFEAAMQGDPSLRAEAESLRATTARLAMAAAEPAPDQLKARVMAEVDQTRQDAPGAPADGVVVALRPRSTPRAVRILGVAAAVLAVAAMGLSAWVVGLNRDNADLVSASAAVTRVITAPDARTVSGPIVGQAGRGAVVVSPSLESAVFVADDLAGAPAGQTYQLWLIGADGSANSAGTFTPGSGGDAAVPLTGTLDAATAVGMTLEPAGGSTQPTTAPVLALPLA